MAIILSKSPALRVSTRNLGENSAGLMNGEANMHSNESQNSNSIPLDLCSAHTPHWVATTGHHEPGARFRSGSGSLML